ncbi:MAG TPA: hypothetical protein DEQ40_10225, partial [Oxalobacteraceae bacterium]|nr:hypothetical protein [Oxalobacteraceae bacterium]
MKSSAFFRACSIAARRAFLCALLGLPASVPALADEHDDAALLLADKAPATVAQASNWQVFVEGAYGGDMLRVDRRSQQNHRLSFDLQYDNAFAPDWRAVFADRLDIDSPPQAGNQNSSINTIKEAYVSWQAR